MPTQIRCSQCGNQVMIPDGAYSSPYICAICKRNQALATAPPATVHAASSKETHSPANSVADQWFYVKDGKKCGPVTSATIKWLAESGQLKSEDMVLQEGTKKWVPAKTVPGVMPTAAVPALPRASSPIPVAEPAISSSQGNRPDLVQILKQRWVLIASILASAFLLLVVILMLSKPWRNDPVNYAQGNTQTKPAGFEIQSGPAEPNATMPGPDRAMPKAVAKPADKPPTPPPPSRDSAPTPPPPSRDSGPLLDLAVEMEKAGFVRTPSQLTIKQYVRYGTQERAKNIIRGDQFDCLEAEKDLIPSQAGSGVKHSLQVFAFRKFIGRISGQFPGNPMELLAVGQLMFQDDKELLQLYGDLHNGRQDDDERPLLLAGDELAEDGLDDFRVVQEPMEVVQDQKGRAIRISQGRQSTQGSQRVAGCRVLRGTVGIAGQAQPVGHVPDRGLPALLLGMTGNLAFGFIGLERLQPNASEAGVDVVGKLGYEGHKLSPLWFGVLGSFTWSNRHRFEWHTSVTWPSCRPSIHRSIGAAWTT